MHVSKLKDNSVAALGTALAGKIYGLTTLKEEIEDNKHNATRFVIMSRKKKEKFEKNKKIKTCFVFRVRNIPAALYKAMGGFATNGVNMVRLESYMLDGSFTATQFFAEIEGHPDDDNVKLALDDYGAGLSSFSGSVRRSSKRPRGISALVILLALLKRMMGKMRATFTLTLLKKLMMVG